MQCTKATKYNLRLHLLIYVSFPNSLVGPARLGRFRRDLPPTPTREGHDHHHPRQLAHQFLHRQGRARHDLAGKVGGWEPGRTR